MIGVYESCFSGKRCIMLLENVGTAEQIKSLIPLNARAVLVIATSSERSFLFFFFFFVSLYFR